MKNAINWFEIPSADFERAIAFYKHIFGFAEMNTMEMMNIHMAFFPYEQMGGVGGAICKSDMHHPAQGGCLVYLNGGEDLSNVLNNVTAAGGEVLMPKTQISAENGYMAIFKDSEGNTVGLHSMN